MDEAILLLKLRADRQFQDYRLIIIASNFRTHRLIEWLFGKDQSNVVDRTLSQRNQRQVGIESPSAIFSAS